MALLSINMACHSDFTKEMASFLFQRLTVQDVGNC